MKNWFSGDNPKKDDPLDALGPLRPFGVLATQISEGFADKLYSIGEGMGGIDTLSYSQKERSSLVSVTSWDRKVPLMVLSTY